MSIISAAVHPLDPLTGEEITEALALLRQERCAGAHWRFEIVELKEPEKASVLGFTQGMDFPRVAQVIALNNADGTCWEADVQLNTGQVIRFEHIPGVQPRVMLDEFVECEAAVKASPLFKQALAKRGVHSTEYVMVDPWSAGNYGVADEKGKRIVRAFVWLRSGPDDNGYAHPIEGIVPIVDLNQMEVLKVEDYGVHSIPEENANYDRQFFSESDFSEPPKPLSITQPEGVGFHVDGWHVRWMNWDFRIGFNAREGLVLYLVHVTDEARQRRPVLYRASLTEMVVPYAESRGNHYRKNAFDVGEYGMGMLANSLVRGCDCLGEIHYFDAVLNDSRGNLFPVKNAICMHEEDFGVLWKHMDWRNERAESRRSRRLVVSFFCSVGNYEYGWYWYFYLDGTIEHEVKLTGIINTSSLPPEGRGVEVAPGVVGQHHTHCFCFRLDPMVDGVANRVVEVDTVSVPPGADNPYGNGFTNTETVLDTEAQAQRVSDARAHRYWKIQSTDRKNRMGAPTAYTLVPHEHVLPFAQPDAPILKRAAFATRHLWVTAYHGQERFPAGQYPNQHPGGDGLPKWTARNRNVRDTDVVLWHCFGKHHTARLEDWPVMPCEYTGFMLKPNGFFDRNPTIAQPPETPGSNGHCCAD